MRSLLIIILVGLGLISPSPAPAVTALSDAELAGVSGGGAEERLDGQSLPQDQQQPGQVSSASASDAQRQGDDGMDLSPGVFAVLQSSAGVDRHRELSLNGTAQQGSRALNLENALSSDIISTANIIDATAAALDEAGPDLDINQANQSGQFHRDRGRLYSSTAAHRYETTTDTRTETEYYDRHTYYLVDRRDRTETFHHQESVWDVEVGRISAAEFVAGIEEVTLVEPWELQLIKPFKVGDTEDAGWLGEYGAEASYGGLTIRGPEASFGGIEPVGDDLLVNATIRLASIDLGDFGTKVCVGGCATGHIDLGEMEVLNLFEALEKVDNELEKADPGYAATGIGFSKDGIILEGLGSIFEEEQNLNTGFALAGKGRIKLLEPPSATIGGEVSFRIETKLGFWFDLSSIDGLGLIKEAVKQVDPGFEDWPIEVNETFVLIDLRVPFTLLDLQGRPWDFREDPEKIIRKTQDPFEIEFEGVLKAQLGDGDIDTGDEVMRYSSIDQTEADNTLVFAASTADIGGSSVTESHRSSVFTGGRMTGAEAELLAMSEGILSVDRSSAITLTEGAQQNMRVVNGVNAASSIAANSLNISRQPSYRAGADAASRPSTRQQNHFNQQR